MIEKQYSLIDKEFVFQWADHWFQLVDLIIQLVRTDRIPPSPPAPTELDEINYMRLHFWFIDHEPEFIPLWKDFYETRDWALHPGHDELVDADENRYLENPFFFCYHPENLYELVRELDIQSGTRIWDPSEHRAWITTMELIQMGKRVVEFFEWVCDRAG